MVSHGGVPYPVTDLRRGGVRAVHLSRAGRVRPRLVAPGHHRDPPDSQSSVVRALNARQLAVTAAVRRLMRGEPCPA